MMTWFGVQLREVDRLGSRFRDWCPMMLRLTLGMIVLMNGMRHFWDAPHPTYWCLVESGAELLGGLFVLLGLYTRLAAMGLAGLMIVKVALRYHYLAFTQTSSQWVFACLMIAVALFIMGGGKYSLDLRWRRMEA